jgi:uncharacterized surface protein with fasciclin (FAS1) repeats
MSLGTGWVGFVHAFSLCFCRCPGLTSVCINPFSLGLYHTFEVADGTSACSTAVNSNDFVADTPAQSGSSDFANCQNFATPGTDGAVDTCPGAEGDDPVLNFMNYVYVCWKVCVTCYFPAFHNSSLLFPQQRRRLRDRRRGVHVRANVSWSGDMRVDVIRLFLFDSPQFLLINSERMYYQWLLYRSTVTGCGDGEMELEFILTFDDEHVDQNQVLIYKDRGTEDEQIIFDSEIDHDEGALPVFQTVMAVDLCVPQSSNYEFVITDSGSFFGGDGFSDGGKALVYQNGVLVATIDDDFDDEIVVQLPAISFAPSVSSTSEASLSPSPGPSSTASLEPSSAPSSGPSSTTSLEPSSDPSPGPSSTGSLEPSPALSLEPSSTGSVSPTATKVTDTETPSATDTDVPIDTSQPTLSPTVLDTTPSPFDVTSGVPSLVTGGSNLLEILAETADVTTFIAAMRIGGLVSNLSGESPLLLLIPSDEAFAELGDSEPEFASVLFEPEWELHLRNLLRFHISDDLPEFSKLLDGVILLPTKNSEGVTVRVLSGVVTFSPTVEGSEAEFLIEDIEASNGLVSVIDSVLRPDFLTLPLDFLLGRYYAEFTSLLVEAGLDEIVMSSFGITVRGGRRILRRRSHDFELTYFLALQVFVPSVSALDGLSRRRLQSGGLNSILALHIMPEVVPTSQIRYGYTSLTSVDGSTAAVAKTPFGITVNGVRILQANILSATGIAHVVGGPFVSPPPAPRPTRRPPRARPPVVKSMKSMKTPKPKPRPKPKRRYRKSSGMMNVFNK